MKARRSADFQSAVSPTSSRQGADLAKSLVRFRRSAGWKPATRQTGSLRYSALVVCAFSLLIASVSALGQPILQTAAQVRSLSPEQASLHLPVRLRGVVTFYDESLFSRFVQDGTAGIYLREATNMPPLVAGQSVEVEGVTSPGEYAPVIVPSRVEVLGPGMMPDARPVSFEQLASGREDSQFVEVQGIVRASTVEAGHRLVVIATGGGRLNAYAQELPSAPAGELVDSTVRVRGVCSTEFNRQRQLFAIRLMVPRREDFILEAAAPAQPFDTPARTIASLLQFTPHGTYGHRVKISGTVIYHQLGSRLFIQDDEHGLLVESKQTTPLQPGDRVEVLGFPAKGEYTPILQDAIYQQRQAGAPPAAAPIDVDEALKGTHDFQLIRIQATLLDRARQSREQFLVLEAGDYVFHAYQKPGEGEPTLAGLENGSTVEVTGVCVVEPGSEWQAGEAWRAKSFRLMLRSPADIVVLHAPPWWTLKKLLWAVGLLGVVVLGAFVWVGVLRRRVQEQTGIIRQKLQAEAALKERYVDLFENANDMVYTHDLGGRMTSINRAGERLLRRQRQQILSCNLVELVSPEQKSAAQQWLEQVGQGLAPATVEWDFATLTGPPAAVEISARLIEQAGRRVEVEAIAREITDRKRLERELLEISNREQRRIGHDLHDGVCQQLVGIAYLTETLADRLQEKGTPEAGEAERIGRLLNTAIAQTRGVARGLFPARLEDSGLVAALEELAGTATELFQMNCRFSSDHPPETIDHVIALHLFYIAQEALANAAKHGKARHAAISLGPSRERFALTIRDDGVGFTAPANGHPGMGLRIMDYRSRVIGASLEIKSQPGAGTEVTCLFSPTFSETTRSPI
jgi:PAS domain S-box-containing protein